MFSLIHTLLGSFDNKFVNKYCIPGFMHISAQEFERIQMQSAVLYTLCFDGFSMFGLVDNPCFVATNSVYKYCLPVIMHVSACTGSLTSSDAGQYCTDCAWYGFGMFGLVDNLDNFASYSVQKYIIPVCMHVSAQEVERLLMQTELGTVLVSLA